MNVLSLFDGISCGRVALERAGIDVTNYYASEIDKYAQQVSASNYPDIIRLGDVTKWREWDIDFSKIDLLLAGFPCQAWSVAGKQGGDTDPRGALVHDLIDIWNEIKMKNPKMKFLFENVKMKKEFQKYVNELFGVEPTLINSALVSAQNRERLYWTNITGISQPSDLGILLKDVIEDNAVSDREKSLAVTSRVGGATEKRYKEKSMHQMVQCGALRGRYLVDGVRQDHKMETAGLTEQRLELRKDGKTNTLTTVTKDNLVIVEDFYKGRPARTYTQKCPTLRSERNGLKVVELSEKEKAYMLRSERNKGFIMQETDAKSKCLTAVFSKGVPYNTIMIGTADINGHDFLKRVYSKEGKCPTLTAVCGGNQERKIATDEKHWRKLTPLECERLQTLPELYTACVSNSQRYKAIGNGWTVDVIAHIFKGLKNEC